MTSRTLAPFGTTIFSEMTRLATEHRAINLAQGFPDFNGPEEMIRVAHEAMQRGENQYTRSMGHPRLVEAVARFYRARYGLAVDPMREVVVTSGCTEGVMSSILGLVSPGDEVVFFEPFYDSYPVAAALAGATARYYTLRAPAYAIDRDALAALFGERTRVVVINTPHNPIGKVFSREELALIAELCIRHDVAVISDEVYENLTYDGAVHVPIATLPGMRERTLTLSSAGKTFSFTGWKVGWGVGPASLVAAAQAAHQFVTFCTPPALQLAVAHALDTFGDDFYATLRAEYAARRDFLVAALRDVGFRVDAPRGTYFIVADYTGLTEPHLRPDDRAFAHDLVRRCGVAAVPPSVFYCAAPEEGRRFLRFAFCKRMETLEAAAERLRALR